MIDEKDNIHEDDALNSSETPRADQPLDQPVGDLDELKQEAADAKQNVEDQLQELEQHNKDALAELENLNQQNLDSLEPVSEAKQASKLPTLDPVETSDLPPIESQVEEPAVAKTPAPTHRVAAPTTTDDDEFNHAEVSNKKMVAGLCAILLGAFGVHKFVMGYTNEGVIYIVAFIVSFFLAIITCGLLAFLPIIPSVLALIEGIIYLTKSEREFYDTYIKNKKAWF